MTWNALSARSGEHSDDTARRRRSGRVADPSREEVEARLSGFMTTFENASADERARWTDPDGLVEVSGAFRMVGR